MRPPFIWNFYGEEEEKVEHLINPEANPEICYKYEENNWVKRTLEACTDLGINLQQHEAANWAKLIEFVIKIFDASFDKYKSDSKAFE